MPARCYSVNRQNAFSILHLNLQPAFVNVNKLFKFFSFIFSGRFRPGKTVCFDNRMRTMQYAVFEVNSFYKIFFNLFWMPFPHLERRAPSRPFHIHSQSTFTAGTEGGHPAQESVATAIAAGQASAPGAKQGQRSTQAGRFQLLLQRANLRL